MIFFLYFFPVLQRAIFPLLLPGQHGFGSCPTTSTCVMTCLKASSSLLWMLCLTISITAPLSSKKMFIRQLGWLNGFSERVLNVFRMLCLSGCFHINLQPQQKESILCRWKDKPPSIHSVQQCLCRSVDIQEER